MLLNIALLFLVFGAEKKKFSPYAAAMMLGLIKGIMYLMFTRNIVFAVGMGLIYAGLAASFVLFLKRIDRHEASERPEIPTYGVAGSERIKFKWEYIPLTIVFLLLIGGEILLR